MATIEEVGKEFLAQRAEFDALDQMLAKERRAIRKNSIKAGGSMEVSDQSRLREIGSTRHELAEALEIFSLVTLERLEKSEDVKLLQLEIVRVNEMLKDDLQSLEQLVDYADKASRVAAGLAAVAGKVSDLVV
ncbi:MAG: hypothetical protein ACRBB6_12695 [Neptuniibacter sp.]